MAVGASGTRLPTNQSNAMQDPPSAQRMAARSSLDLLTRGTERARNPRRTNLTVTIGYGNLMLGTQAVLAPRRKSASDWNRLWAIGKGAYAGQENIQTV